MMPPKTGFEITPHVISYGTSQNPSQHHNSSLKCAVAGSGRVITSASNILNTTYVVVVTVLFVVLLFIFTLPLSWHILCSEEGCCFFMNTDKRTISDVRGQQRQLPTGQRVTATGSRSSMGLGGWARRIRLLEHMGYSSLLAACVSSSPGIVTSTRGMLSTLTGLFMAGGDFSPPGSAGVDTQRAITAKGLLALVTFRVLLSWWPGRILRIFFRSEWERLC